MTRMIPASRARRQFALHAVALLLLLAACYQPARLVRPAAILMCLACLALCFNLAAAARLYWQQPAVRSPLTPIAPL